MTIRPYQRSEPALRRMAHVLARHWLLVFNLSLGLLVFGAVAAPALMTLGMEGPGRVFYALYGLMCHQFPQRSYFLFGPQLVQTYSWEQLLAAGMDPVRLRQFVGTAKLGYKLGLAHRNTAIYFSVFAGGLLFALSAPLRRRGRWHVSIRGYLLAWLLAMLLLGLDGGSHLVSEITGWGFRASNEWLRSLTGDAFLAHFYAGDGIGSFNWLMRTLTGGLMGLTTVWFVLSLLQKAGERSSSPASQLVSPSLQ